MFTQGYGVSIKKVMTFHQKKNLEKKMFMLLCFSSSISLIYIYTELTYS